MPKNDKKTASGQEAGIGSGETNPASAKSAPVGGIFADVSWPKLEVKIEDMFKAGVHFGHHKSRKNPRMDDFIFGTKNAINIIDLEKTKEKLEEAMKFLAQVAASGQQILFVGTKKQAKKLVEAAAQTCGMPYVSERWLGGTFTNFDIISKRTKYLKDGQEKIKKGEYGHYTKFEQMKIREELDKMETKMGGIKHMNRLPGAVFAISVVEDGLAIKEARKKRVPVVALVDTNINPELVDYPIPANEDAVSSIRLMLSYIVKAVLEGKNKAVVEKEIKEEKANENNK